MDYGKEHVIAKPQIGLWSKKKRHKHRKRSRPSGRAAFASRSTMPETAVLMRLRHEVPVRTVPLDQLSTA